MLIQISYNDKIRMCWLSYLAGTFKLQKLQLQREGFDTAMIKDPIYFLKDGNYVILSKELYQGLISGKLRL